MHVIRLFIIEIPFFNEVIIAWNGTSVIVLTFKTLCPTEGSEQDHSLKLISVDLDLKFSPAVCSKAVCDRESQAVPSLVLDFSPL